MITTKYTKDWQPYDMNYEKFEVDVKLKDGRIIENCYPNAGKFNSFSKYYNGQQFDETLVVEIRLSHNEILEINP